MDKKFDEEKKKVKRKYNDMKEEEKQELAVARGEVTPPATPSKERKIGNVRRSPGTTSRNKARLLDFHLECEEQRGLPPSRLQEEIRREERTARLRGEEWVGLDLRKEFERLGAETQHLSLTTAMEGTGRG